MNTRTTLLIDAGNSHTKAQLLTPDPDQAIRLSFSSVVADLGTSPPDIPGLYDPADGKGFVFRWAGRYWAVGNVAENTPDAQLVQGGRRYQTDAWRALIAGAICALVPASDQINLMVAVPLRGGDAAKQEIQTGLHDTWRVKLYNPTTERGNTGHKTIEVMQVSTMPETAGSYFYHLLNEDGTPRPDSYFTELNRQCQNGVQDLFDRGALVVDGGGWSVDLLPIAGLHPDFDRAVTLRGSFGLHWVARWFQDALQSHPVVGGGSDRPQRVLIDALIPEYTRGGKPRFRIQYGRKTVDVQECVEEAVSRLDDAIAENIITALDGGVDNAFLFLTGGAAEAAHPWLESSLDAVAARLGIEHHVIVMQPDIDTPPYFHNVEGMARYLLRKLNRMQAG